MPSRSVREFGRQRWMLGFMTGLVLVALGAGEACSGDWPGWRGPEGNGVSRETALPEKWAPDGENLVWKQPHGGRSTPIVLNGRVYILNRAGSGKTEQERVMCFDAATGQPQWEHRFNIFLTDIPSNRVGWASPVGDPETGYVFAHGVQGTLLCLDRDGRMIWLRSLHEEYGTISGYGGRTYTPIVDEDRVIISFLNSSWGQHGKGGHRYVAFDKRTGQVVWWAEPGGKPLDTTYSTPVIAVVNGVRLLIDGSGDGGIHAFKARTGEKVWDFAFSERGINASVVFDQDRVYAAHSEENLDSTAMGRVVCIDATGRGDVTKTHEKWRIDGIPAGYSSPAFHDGRLYLFDNAANLMAIDGASGKVHWRHSVGTVMKSSPVVADEKIYVGEVNARFVILKPAATSCVTLSEVNFPSPDGKVVEVNGSPAVSNGRIYFTTRDELCCLGSKVWTGTSGPIPPLQKEEPPGAGEPPATIAVVPADVVVLPGQSVAFSWRAFDSKGRPLPGPSGPTAAVWAPKGLNAKVSETGKLTVDSEAGFGAGTVEARVGSLAGEARVRVVPGIPFTADFEKIDDGKPPPGWIGAGAKFLVATVDGQKVLRKVADDVRFVEAETFFGLPTWSGYTVQADIRGVERKRQLPDVKIVNCGYHLALMGNTQRLRIVAWIPQPRVDVTVPFAWKPDVWYRMKFRVDQGKDKGLARGKVWPRDEAEPEKWTIELEDPILNLAGSPALQAYSAGTTAKGPGAESYFDNVKVMKNEP